MVKIRMWIFKRAHCLYAPWSGVLAPGLPVLPGRKPLLVLNLVGCSWVSSRREKPVGQGAGLWAELLYMMLLEIW